MRFPFLLLLIPSGVLLVATWDDRLQVGHFHVCAGLARLRETDLCLHFGFPHCIIGLLFAEEHVSNRVSKLGASILDTAQLFSVGALILEVFFLSHLQVLHLDCDEVFDSGVGVWNDPLSDRIPSVAPTFGHSTSFGKIARIHGLIFLSLL